MKVVVEEAMFKGSSCFSWFAVGMKIAGRCKWDPGTRTNSPLQSVFTLSNPNSGTTAFHSSFVIRVPLDNTPST